jgi:hypothetical protein
VDRSTHSNFQGYYLSQHVCNPAIDNEGKQKRDIGLIGAGENRARSNEIISFLLQSHSKFSMWCSQVSDFVELKVGFLTWTMDMKMSKLPASYEEKLMKMDR